MLFRFLNTYFGFLEYFIQPWAQYKPISWHYRTHLSGFWALSLYLVCECPCVLVVTYLSLYGTWGVSILAVCGAADVEHLY